MQIINDLDVLFLKHKTDFLYLPNQWGVSLTKINFYLKIDFSVWNQFHAKINSILVFHKTDFKVELILGNFNYLKARERGCATKFTILWRQTNKLKGSWRYVNLRFFSRNDFRRLVFVKDVCFCWFYVFWLSI